MASYLIIESRDSAETFGDTRFADWLTGLVGLGHDATVFLTQNAVIAARPDCTWNAGLQGLQEAGVQIVLDDFYAIEKSLDATLPGIERVQMEQIVDRIMSPSTRTVWH